LSEFAHRERTCTYWSQRHDESKPVKLQSQSFVSLAIPSPPKAHDGVYTGAERGPGEPLLNRVASVIFAAQLRDL
jgi:hypothetical protein